MHTLSLYITGINFVQNLCRKNSQYPWAALCDIFDYKMGHYPIRGADKMQNFEAIVFDGADLASNDGEPSPKSHLVTRCEHV